MEAFLSSLVSVAFHGAAYGMILYVISVGLSVTMGLMGFVNLAHGVFAMAGGYILIAAMDRFGVPYPLALVLAFALVAAGSVVLERLLYSRLYTAGELAQVLFTIGLIFIAVATARLLFGTLQLLVPLPDYLKGQFSLLGRDFPAFRVFLIAFSAVMVGLLWYGVERTRWGAMVRAAVDNGPMARAIGINTRRLFTVTFALGSGLAGLGGALGAEILTVQPIYPFEHLVYFLIVVAVGGLGSLRGPFFAALLIGVTDTACKYWVPQFGAFFIYVTTIAILLWRPAGLFGEAGMIRRASYGEPARIGWLEWLPWAAALAVFFALPEYVPLGARVLVYILFALSLDLILGYAGIITLGHTAFFGLGAYVAGILGAKLGVTDPLLQMAAAAAAAALLGVATGAVILRTKGLTLLMLTLAITTILLEIANKATAITGGADGLSGIVVTPILGQFRFDMFGKTAYLYCLLVLFAGWWIVRRIVYSPFGASLVGIRENVVRMHAIGSPAYARLVAVYTISATIAGCAGALLTQTNQFVGLNVLSFEFAGELLVMLVLGGVGRIYGAFVGPLVYMIAQDQLAKQFPEYWYFGIGLLLVAVVLFARGGLLGIADRVVAKFRGGPG